ncbi:MAG: gluconate 2-dehydrogenase subunit 3 family protein [Acidobacteriota bacterium]
MKRNKANDEMDRREALRRLAVGAGASAALAGCAAEAQAAPTLGVSCSGSADSHSSLSAENWKPKFFDLHQNETLIVLSDLIIPQTDTPGAKSVQVNRIIDAMLSSEAAEVQQEYLQALGWFDGYCISHYSKPFIGLDENQQIEVLTLFAYTSNDPRMAHGQKLFRTLKTSVVEVYYNSETGLLQELKYETNPVHLNYPGCQNPDEHN